MLFKMNPVITLRDFFTDRKLSLLSFPYIVCFFTGGKWYLHNNYDIISSNRHLYDICLTYEDDIESEQSGHRVGSEFSSGRKSAYRRCIS